MTNGNGEGPIIQTPSGPRMLHGQDERQSRTDQQQRPEVLTLDSQQQAEVLTLVPDTDSGTTMAGENVAQVNGVDDIHSIVARRNLNDANRVEDDTISVSVGNDHLSDDGLRNRSYKQMHDARNRTPLGTRAQSPRSPEMPILEPMTNTFRPITARETPLHSRPASRGSVYSRAPTRTSERSQTNLNLLGSLMHRIVDDASNLRQQLTEQTQQFTNQTIKLVHDAANKHAEAEILRKEKEWIEKHAEMEMRLVKQFSAKETEMFKTQTELANQRENRQQKLALQREEIAKQREDTARIS